MKNSLWRWSYLFLALLTLPAKGTVIYWDPEGTATPTAAGYAGTWDTVSAQWSTTSAQTATPGTWVSGDAACFCAGSTTITTPFTVNVDSAITIAGIFNGSLTPPGVFITISGAGSLTLAAGADAFDTGGADGGTTTIAVPITGSGQVAFEGKAQMYFNATNTYTGGSIFGYPGVAAFTSTVNFNNGKAFGTGPIQMSSSGGGCALVVEGTSPITLANSFIATNVNLNIVGNPAGLTFTGPWNLAATPQIGSGGVAANLITISGVMSGVGGFIKYNPGTLVLSGANTFSGGTTISNGVLSVSADNNLGTAPSTANYNIFLDGGTLNASNTFTLNPKRLIYLGANSTLSVSGGKTLTYAGAITGLAALTKSGAGTLVLSGGNGYNGATTIASGTLEADSQSGSATSTNAVLVQAGTTLSGNGLLSGPVSGTGSINPGPSIGPATLTLGGGLDLSSGGTFVWNLSSNSTIRGFSTLSVISGNLSLGGSSKFSLNFIGTAGAPATNNPFWQTQEAWTVVSVSGSAGNSGMTKFTTLVSGNYTAGNFTNYVYGNGNIVLLYQPNFPVFDALYDAGPGFFSGENLSFTNFSGLALYAWSSTNGGLAVSNWSPLGPMQEQPLAPALPGYSRYSINVSPTVSPTYVVAGNRNTGPYIFSPVPCTILTTSDFASFNVVNTNVDIDTNGVLALLPPKPVFLPGGGYSSSGFQLQFSAGTNENYIIQASTDLSAWTNLSSGTVSTSPVTFMDPDATNYPARFYRVVLP